MRVSIGGAPRGDSPPFLVIASLIVSDREQPPSSQQRQHAGWRPASRPAASAAGGGFRVLAPVGRSASPRRHARRSRLASAVSRPRACASASRAEPVSVVMTCSAARPKASKPSSAAAMAEVAASGCATGMSPSATAKRAPSASRAQAEHRIPQLGLPPHQPFRLGCAIAEEIAAGILDDIGAHLGLAAPHAVDGRVGEPGQRHGGGIDVLAAGPPIRPRWPRPAPWSARASSALAGVRTGLPSSRMRYRPPPCGEGLGWGESRRQRLAEPSATVTVL